MKIFLSILLLVFSQTLLAEKKGIVYDFPITRVLDGDTVAFKADFLPDPLKKELSIRIYGVDTPEKGHRAKCTLENERGNSATQFTIQMIQNAKKRQVVILEWDKFGGRVLGDILLDGVSLRSQLIEKGLARPYFGEAKKSWC